MERSEPCRYEAACEIKMAEYTVPDDNFSLLRRGTIGIQESSPLTDQVHELPRNHRLGGTVMRCALVTSMQTIAVASTLVLLLLPAKAT